MWSQQHSRRQSHLFALAGWSVELWPPTYISGDSGKPQTKLHFPVDLIKQNFSDFIWLHYDQYIKKREFALVMIHRHTTEAIALSWDDTWRGTLLAQSIPCNTGPLQLEVRLSQDYIFHPRLPPRDETSYDSHN